MQTYSEIKNAVQVREAAYGTEIMDMHGMADIYEGVMPPEFEAAFPRNTPKHPVNYIRLGWDNLAQSIARTPEVQVDPEDSSASALRASQKLEKIAASYLQNADPFESAFLFANAWNLVGLGRAVAIAIPDKETKRPRLEHRDPRYFYPGAKRKVGNYIAELKDGIFVHEMTEAEAELQGLYHSPMDRAASQTNTVKIYEYIDDMVWNMVGPNGTKASKHNLGVVPIAYMQTFAPNKSGISQFAEQVSLMVAVSRIITQKMAFIDRMIYPITWVKGLSEEITVGPNSLNVLEDNGSMGQLTPPVQLQIDRDLQNLEKYQRILNRNTEVRQGEVDGKGAYVGSKTLEALDDSVNNDIARYWEIVQNGYQKLIAICLTMDEKLYPVEKTYSVLLKGQATTAKYIPKEDINGRRNVRVSFGFGKGGGYQAFLENVQGFQAGLVPKRVAVEETPGVTDSNQRMRELELDQMDEIGVMNFKAMAQQGQIDMVAWGKLRAQMEKKGLSLYEAVQKFEKQLREQAQEAQQSPVPESGLTTPPMQEAPAQEEAELPGVPMAAMMAG